MKIERMPVGEIMQRDLLTAPAGESLRTAALMMRERRVRCLLVPPTRSGDGVGILTSKDVVQVVMQEGGECLDELCVADVMTRPAISVQADMAVEECFQLMRSTSVRRMPVQHGSELVGLISCSDMFAFAIDGEPL